MKAAVLVAVGLALGCGCAHRTRQARAPVPPAIPGVFQTLHRQAVNAMDAGEGDLALAALRRRLALEPDNLQVRLTLMRRYREAGFADLAVEHGRLASQRFPESAELQVELAKSLRAMGMTAEAAAGLEIFFRSHPRASAEVPAWLGILRDELGQWEQGEAAHRAALALAPDRDYLYNNLGFNLLRQGRIQEARQALERALAINPKSRVARNNLGLALAAEGQPALEEFEKTADAAAAHNNLACALIEQGRYAEARKELQIALAYNRNHAAALANLRLIAELDGEPPSATLTERPRTRGFWSTVWRVIAGTETKSSERPAREKGGTGRSSKSSLRASEN